MRTRSPHERRANTRYAGEEWAEDVEMNDADVDRTEDDRCVPDENSDPNVVPPVVTPDEHVDKRRRRVYSKKTRPRVADPGPPADRADEYLDVGDRTTSCHFCDAPLWELEVQDAHDEVWVWSEDDRKVVVLGGDFKQCLPVVKYSAGLSKRQAQIDAAASKWQHWGGVQLLQLRKNMRVERCLQSDRPADAERLRAWAEWLYRMGEGTLDGGDRVRVPDGGRAWESSPPFDLLFTPTAETKEDRELEFFERMYGPVKDLEGDDRDRFLRETAVLVAKNLNADRINDLLMDRLIVGTAHTYTSLNKTSDQNAQADDQYPEEYLSSIKDGRLPAHVLKLKIGAPIIALRNITKGVSNGTRMVVTRLLRNSIFARVLHGPKVGQEVAITKVFTTHNMGAFQLQRRQLPIRVAFAMTINKAQGLTLRRVGVHVEEDVFSHGQLYVAFSRCGDPKNLWVFGPEPDEDGAVWIKNVVFKEVLIDDR